MGRKGLAASVLLLMQAVSVPAADKVNVTVKVIDRRDSSTRYAYVLPGYSNATSNTNLNCYGNSASVDCSATTRTTESTIPGRTGSYDVQGATLSLELPDGRVVVVNCQSKYAPKGDYVNRRSCRIPPVNDLQVEFNGDKAKLKWPVSLDGKKLESETYKIIAVLQKQ